MQSLIRQPTANREEPFDLAAEVARLEKLLSEQQAELSVLREELHKFKARYAQVVGSRLAELADIEQAIREAEARLHPGVETAPGAEEVGDGVGVDGVTVQGAERSAMAGGLRGLFWSVAKLFHPDHAADEAEARRRHQIMVEASRAYREGDTESLETLLGDDELHFYCTGAQGGGNPEDLQSRLLTLKEALRTAEFGIKRLRQDGLYRIKLSADEEAGHGRDALAEEAKRIGRQIIKARHRLTNLA